MAFWLVRSLWEDSVTETSNAPGSGGVIESFVSSYQSRDLAESVAERSGLVGPHFNFPGRRFTLLVFDDADFGPLYDASIREKDAEIGVTIPDRWMRQGTGKPEDPYTYVPVWSTAAALRNAQAGIAGAEGHPSTTIVARHGVNLLTDLGVGAELTLALRAVAEAAGIGVDEKPAMLVDPTDNRTLHRLSTAPWRCAAAMASLERHATRHSALAFFRHQALLQNDVLLSGESTAAQRAAAYIALLARFDSAATAAAAAAWSPPPITQSAADAEREMVLAQEYMSGKAAISASVAHAKEQASRQLQQPARGLSDVPVTHRGYSALVRRLGQIDGLAVQATARMFNAHLKEGTTATEMRGLVDTARRAIAAKGTERIAIPPAPSGDSDGGAGAGGDSSGS